MIKSYFSLASVSERQEGVVGTMAPCLKLSVAPRGCGPSAIRILGPLIFQKHGFLSNIYRFFFFNIASFHLKILFGLNTANPRARFGLSGLRFVTSAWPKRTAREGADQGLILSQDQRVRTVARARCQQLQGTAEKVPVIWSPPPSPGEAPQPARPPQLAVGWKGAHMGHSCGCVFQTDPHFPLLSPTALPPQEVGDPVLHQVTPKPRPHQPALHMLAPPPPTPHAPSQTAPLPLL